MNKIVIKNINHRRLKYIISVAVISLVLIFSLLVFANKIYKKVETHNLLNSKEQSSLNVANNPQPSTLSVSQGNTQQKLIYGQLSVDNLLENINLRRKNNGLGELASNQYLNTAAEKIVVNRAIGTDNKLFSDLMKSTGYKYSYVASSILASCSDLSCALRSLEYANTDKGIYNPIYKDIGIAVSLDANYAIILWGQPYQQVASNYSGGSSSSSSGNTFVLPDWSYKYTPPDIDYSRPSPTLDTNTTTPTNSCTPVTSSEPNKYYYRCVYGQRATGVNCKAIAPYDYTSNLWSCNK